MKIDNFLNMANFKIRNKSKKLVAFDRPLNHRHFKLYIWTTEIVVHAISYGTEWRYNWSQ